MYECGTDRQNTDDAIWRMRIACLLTKAKALKICNS